MREIFRDPVLKKLVFRCITFNVILAGVWYFVPWAGPRWLKGQLFGAAVAVLFFGQMRLTLARAVRLPAQKATEKVRMGYAVRMVFYALIFFLSYYSPDISVIPVIIGVVSMKYTVLLSFTWDKGLAASLNRPKKED